MKHSRWRATAFGLLVTGAGALDNGLALSPQMGYNTWNDFRCDGLTSERVKSIADRMVDSGLLSAGYHYLNIDDCWSRELSAEGRLIADPDAFPEGIEALIDYVHSRGLLFGIYTCRGVRTCAFRPGSKNLERLHARQFAEWGVDYVKEDSCWASGKHERAFAEYARMRDALNGTGRQIFFSLCGWNAWYAPQGQRLGNSWRIAPDCDEWANVYVAIRTNERLARFAGPGGWNDPDMLVGSNPAAAAHLTPQQVQSQFSMWAVMASPLLIGSALLRMPESDRETYVNPEVIAINQDPLGTQGEPLRSNCPPFVTRDNFWMAPWTMPPDVAQAWTLALCTLLAVAAVSLPLLGGSLRQRARRPHGRGAAYTGVADSPAAAPPQPRHVVCGSVPRGCVLLLVLLLVLVSIPAAGMLAAIHIMKPRVDPCQQVWARPLSGGAHALCFINFAPEAAVITCDHACMAQIGMQRGAHARDVVAHVDMGERAEFALTIPGDGGSMLLRLVPVAGGSDSQNVN